jgi:maltose alpha-D-glucosyltransferase / alpha-amylase
VSLVEQLRSARWFGGKSRAIREVHVVDRAAWTDDASMRLVEVRFDVGAPETYVLADRFDEPSVARALLERFGGAALRTECGGVLAFQPTRALQAVPAERTEPIAPLRGEQSNTSICFGDALILKLFRRVQYGPNPDVEVGWFLTERSQFRGTPVVAGSIEYTAPDGRTASVALLQRFEPNRGDAWRGTLHRLDALLAGRSPADAVEHIARLGQTTAELHLALASGSGDFGVEPITSADVAAWRQAIVEEVERAVEALARQAISVDAATLLRRAAGIEALEGSLKARHHGDYHLGQVLEREDGSFVIIDFEGEPSKPAQQRREKRSPLRDVAGMLRSFDYARNTALRAGSPPPETRAEAAERWYHTARETFLETYLRWIRQGRAELLPRDVDAPLAALELEKAAYEVLYELNHRPDWLPIPLAALR